MRVCVCVLHTIGGHGGSFCYGFNPTETRINTINNGGLCRMYMCVPTPWLYVGVVSSQSIYAQENRLLSYGCYGVDQTR